MKIYLFLNNRLFDFSLPEIVDGSFSFDFDSNEELKLINIEARDSSWVLYSTNDVKIFLNNGFIESVKLESNSFYILSRNNKKFLIYVTDLLDTKLLTYNYDKNLNMIVGNTTDCNVIYSSEFFRGLLLKIHYVDDKLVVEKGNDSFYVNSINIKDSRYYINNGDTIVVYGMRIMFFSNFIVINDLTNVRINEAVVGLKKYVFNSSDPIENIDIKDTDLYSIDAYFSKSPRVRRIIETKEIKLSAPPQPDNNQELPLILTLGPMFTMGISSGVMLVEVIDKIQKKQATVQDSWPSLVSSGAMLLSMLLWPILTNIYNKRLKKKRREEIIKKYSAYLDEKREELRVESKLQRDILIENLITVDECLEIIKNRNVNFWDKRVDQSDFLVVRIGMGQELLDAKVDYPEEGFTIEEDELRKQADKMVADFKYINDVPVGYSLFDNKVTAVMGISKDKSVNFVNNIILQLVTFYSYEDLKIVVFTNEDNAYCWEYLKYMNYCFTNDKKIRFFSETVESSKDIAEYLNYEISNRVSSSGSNRDKKNNFKPHYLVIIDDYSRVKRHEFINTLTESDDDLGFSALIIENRLSKLPSKCNNFISLGVTNSGVLKNSYEKQEQTLFKDEIRYGINMMNIAKILSNIPIEFEGGLYSLPDAVSFMEMEQVGKVEQLNILNRWSNNDSTNSLRAEIGLDENGDLMYLDLHEKYHGPHGLIAGTTGSGKSEFIITYILSMCINYSPDDISFILIDYKGGGLALAFENKAIGIILPHLAGTITNLDKAEMDRTLVSIDSEVKRRQRMFNEARDKLEQSTIDIYKYQKFYHEGRLDEPIPHLFIICDEFAELKSQQPDFMDNLISVARIGRSLGVHLILATQKPSGVVNDQIWSNTKFRVCLKVQDEADSKEMLKRPEAAHITQAGRYYLQVGYDEYFALGQSGWCGAKYFPSDKIVKQVDKSVNFINDCGAFIKSIQASTNNSKVQAQGEQLGAILKLIIKVADKVGKHARRLWLENIPAVIIVDELEKKYNIVSNSYDVNAIIGEYDAPEKQEQGIVKYNYLDDGNTIVYGNDGKERELFLSSLIYSTAKNHTAEEVNFYVVDYGSEQLRRYVTLPQVGGMVFLGEDEKFNNLLKLIREEIKYRKQLFIDYGGEYLNYLKNSGKKLPLKVIIFNNYDSIYEAYQNLYDDLPELVRDSSRYGIVYIFTANAVNSIPTKIAQNFTNIYAYKLKDVSDYMSVFGVRAKSSPRDFSGRGYLNNGALHEFQTSNIVKDEDMLNDFLTEFIKKQKEINKTNAKKIPTLPSIVKFNDVQTDLIGLKSVPVGINKSSLDIEVMDYTMNVGNVISSTRLQNTEKFIRSLLEEFRIATNNNVIVIDGVKELMLNTSLYPNYYTSDYDKVLENLIKYIDELIDKKQQIVGVIVIYGIYKFLSKLDGTGNLEDLLKKLKKYEKISIIIVDDAIKIKKNQYDSWFNDNFVLTDGVWVGKGVSDSSLFNIANFSRELTKEYKNNMGFIISESTPRLIKLIDFVSTEGDDNDE